MSGGLRRSKIRSVFEEENFIWCLIKCLHIVKYLLFFFWLKEAFFLFSRVTVRHVILYRFFFLPFRCLKNTQNKRWDETRKDFCGILELFSFYLFYYVIINIPPFLIKIGLIEHNLVFTPPARFMWEVGC